MVSAKSIENQLKRLGFNHRGWGRTEIRELQNIILPDEEIYECANGVYEGGFAMLLATDVRVLLVDKKPLNYLTVEDLRFDMINEIDYNHRLFGANIRISAGETNLKFTSFNQPRLRKLIGHVQQCMAEAKKKQSTHQEGQHQHLEQINQQLRSYLVAQFEQQQKLYEHLRAIQTDSSTSAELLPPEPAKPSPELADYLFAQSLLAQQGAKTYRQPETVIPALTVDPLPVLEPAAAGRPAKDQLAELYSDGLQEVFGKHEDGSPPAAGTDVIRDQGWHNPSGVHPLHIAYSKLPLVLRNRRLGRPLFEVPKVPPVLPDQP